MTAGAATMRAVQFDHYGPSAVLEVRAIAVPAPARNEVLVRVHASGLNPKDALVRAGAMRLLTGRTFPRGTGDDFAGTVTARGAGVTDLAIGDRVWGFLDGFRGGAAAEYVAVRREWTARMPERLGWIEAAGLPLVGSTALQGLRDVARLSRGESLLIKGASGGVGSAAIQIAKALGAYVTALATGAGLDHCQALGADVLVDYRRTDPTSLSQRFDVFFDTIGGSPYRTYRRLLRRRGRWVATMPAAWFYPTAPISRIVAPLLGQPKLGFVVVRPKRADLEELARLADRGQLRMPVMATYPLDQIRAAHDAVAEKHGRGKRVLVISPEAARETAARESDRAASPVR
jgi:NADPH:quinone reductase-like Zn-dependent oxidoreductase